MGLCYLEKVKNIPRRRAEAEPKLESIWDSQFRVAEQQKQPHELCIQDEPAPTCPQHSAGWMPLAKHMPSPEDPSLQ